MLCVSDLVTCDVRVLIKLEEERSVSRHFSRIFPTERTHTFHKSVIIVHTQYGLCGRGSKEQNRNSVA